MRKRKKIFCETSPCPLVLPVFLCAHGDRRSDRRRGSKDEAKPFLMPKGIERQKGRALRAGSERRSTGGKKQERGIRKNPNLPPPPAGQRQQKSPYGRKKRSERMREAPHKTRSKKEKSALNQKNFFCKRSPAQTAAITITDTHDKAK